MIIAICNQVLPAYAGMIRKVGEVSSDFGSAPRVCGDDPLVRIRRRSSIVCSPRMRG